MPEVNKEFDIANVIDEKLIALDLDVSTKVDMLNALTDCFEKEGKLNDREAFFKDVMWREGEGETGIGMGVAIPHGKSHGVNKTALAIGTTKNDLEWGSLDNEPDRGRFRCCAPQTAPACGDAPSTRVVRGQAPRRQDVGRDAGAPGVEPGRLRRLKRRRDRILTTGLGARKLRPSIQCEKKGTDCHEASWSMRLHEWYRPYLYG